MLVWFLLVAGCKKPDSAVPAPATSPAPSAADAMRVMQLSPEAAVGGDAATGLDAAAGLEAAVGLDAAASPDAPNTSGVVDLAAMPMAGPFATRAKLCSIQTCAPDPQNGPTAASIHMDCPTELPPGYIGLRMARPPAPFTEVFLQPTSCLEQGDVSDDNGNYRIVVRRGDGFYVSSPILLVNSNPKYCGTGLEATWKVHDLDASDSSGVVLSIEAYKDCLTCGKQGNERSRVDLLVAIANAKDRPVFFRPLVTGQHFHQHAEDWISPDNDCPKIDRDVVLSMTWGPGTLSLRGAPRWKRGFVEPDGAVSAGFFEVDPPVASTAGTYRFLMP